MPCGTPLTRAVRTSDQFRSDGNRSNGVDIITRHALGLRLLHREGGHGRALRVTENHDRVRGVHVSVGDLARDRAVQDLGPLSLGRVGGQAVDAGGRIEALRGVQGLRAWTWGAWSATGAATRQIPAMATPAPRQQRRARRISRTPRTSGVTCTVTEPHRIYCTMVQLV